MQENWISVPGYEDLYEVSDLGNVRSLHGETVRDMKIGYTRGGYRAVILSLKGKTKNYRMNRLVLIAFHGDRPDRQAAHKNGVRTDNRLRNLYWATTEQNAADRVRHGTILKGQAQATSILTEADVRQVRKIWSMPNHPSAAELALEYGVSGPTLWKAATGRTWSHVA